MTRKALLVLFAALALLPTIATARSYLLATPTDRVTRMTVSSRASVLLRRPIASRGRPTRSTGSLTGCSNSVRS